jgi:hypothetical protein
MECTLPATWRLPPLTWRLVALAVLATLNAFFLILTLAGYLFASSNIDWTLSYAPAAQRVADGTLYDWTTVSGYGVAPMYVFRYSPIAAWIFAGLAFIGPLGWTLVHFPPLLALPRRLAVLALVSAPFWNDVYNGNIQVFVLVAAVTALRGSRLGAVSFFALALLAPKPLMLPVLVWLLWKRPETRTWFAGALLLNIALVALSGYGPEWIGSLLRAGDDFGNRADLGPANIIGAAWVPLGIVLAGWFTWTGRLGMASICASPYWLLHYLLMGLLGVRSQR